MNLAISLLTIPLAVIGHMALWISLWNRVQSTSMPIWLIESLSSIFKVACAALPPILLAGIFIAGLQSPFGIACVTYGFVTCVIATVGVPTAISRRRNRSVKTKLKSCTSKIETISSWREQSAEDAGIRNRFFLSLSINQAVEIDENCKEVEVPRLSPKLDGLKIAHISDLHFTGQICRSFFDRAIDLVNEMDADLVAITGDIVDKPEYINWIPGTLGRLRSRYGNFVVLGNHDLKNNLPQLRLALAENGLNCLGGRKEQINVRGQEVLLAGNELPWIPPSADMEDCPSREDLDHLRILLSHSPDQIDWARRYDFDLMLAGHTHGGQFCLPFYGPVVCPSRLPLDFASGTIYEEPTVLHVSRGLSAEIPLRINCRPEITQLVLRCPVENLTNDEQKNERPLTKPLTLPTTTTSEGISFELTPPVGSGKN